MQEYVSTLKRIYFKQDNPRKFNQKDFMREIRGAYVYSLLGFCQSLLIDIKSGKITSDELHGELQIKLKESYDAYTKEFSLRKLPKINFDEFFLGEK